MTTRNIYGKPIDGETRCVHYHSDSDIIAIKFKCCGHYYPCYECHQESVSHDAQVWSTTDWDEKAVLCGSCDQEMTINQYMTSGNQCPFCRALFNPNCAKHYPLYFETAS